jgi:hypothetical protein
MSRQKVYWVWVDSKRGCFPHELPEAMKEDDEIWGRSCQTWKTAEFHLRRLMKLGYVARVYLIDAQGRGEHV